MHTLSRKLRRFRNQMDILESLAAVSSLIPNLTAALPATALVRVVPRVSPDDTIAPVRVNTAVQVASQPVMPIPSEHFDFMAATKTATDDVGGGRASFSPTITHPHAGELVTLSTPSVPSIVSVPTVAAPGQPFVAAPSQPAPGNSIITASPDLSPTQQVHGEASAITVGNDSDSSPVGSIGGLPPVLVSGQATGGPSLIRPMTLPPSAPQSLGDNDTSNLGSTDLDTMEYSWHQVDVFPASGVHFSNYDATTLDMILSINVNDSVPVVGSVFFPGNPFNEWESVPVSLTVTTNVGHWDYHTPDEYGMSDSNATSLTLTGTAADLVDNALDDVNLVLPPNYDSDVSISYELGEAVVTVDDNGVVQSVGSSSYHEGPYTWDVALWDDGSYKATLQDLKSLSMETGSLAQDMSGAATILADPTGVRDGIDWNTLSVVGRGNANSPTYSEKGMLWTVKTVAGSTINLFEADPKELQADPPRNLPTYQDPSYNCHGYTFGAKDVVCPDGQTRSFQIIQPQDVNPILADAYNEVTVDQAYALAGTKKLVFVFRNGASPEHSAVNSPGQSFFKSTILGFTNGLGSKTVVSSKNGSKTFQQNTTINALNTEYPDCKIKIYVLKP
jgi:hypothetical protein